MPLTEFQIRSLAPREKPYKVTDDGGLHLLVQTSGSRLWRWIYRVPGSRQKTDIRPLDSKLCVAVSQSH
jgi:hypothetical protein